MLDMLPSFMKSDAGSHAKLAELAGVLTKNAQTRYGLVLGGVYWRVDETLAAPVAQWATAAVPVAAPVHGDIATGIENYERATAAELAEFEAAWQRDRDTQIEIGDRTYSSDLAPLGDDSARA
jgi:hypothetical protein